MPQISLYIDDATLKKVESAAFQRRISISKWVAEQIRSKIEPVYPKEFESLFGSLADDSFVRPNQHDFAQDTPREPF